MNKSNNPFKMWGSWLGVGLVIIYFIILPLIFSPSGMDEQITCYLISLNCSGEFAGLATIFFYSFLIAGFLVGWLIHSLIRRAKK